MLSRSPDWDSIVTRGHVAVSQLVVINSADQVVLELDDVDGSVSVDATAAQLRSFEATVADEDGSLTPAGLADVLGPGGCRVRALRGIYHEVVGQYGYLKTAQTDWDIHTSVGQLNGVAADSNGVLTLGWV